MLAVGTDVTGVGDSDAAGQIAGHRIILAEGLEPSTQFGHLRAEKFIQGAFGVDFQRRLGSEQAHLGIGDTGEPVGHVGVEFVTDGEAGGGLVTPVAHEQILALRNRADQAETAVAAGAGNQVVGVGTGQGDGRSVEEFGQAAGNETVDARGVRIVVGDDDCGQRGGSHDLLDGNVTGTGGQVAAAGVVLFQLGGEMLCLALVGGEEQAQ